VSAVNRLRAFNFLYFAMFAKPGRETAWMAAAAGMYALRFALGSMAGSAYGLVALQDFQGLTFVIFYVGALQYLYRIVPEQWKATGQAEMTVTFFGISGIVGSSIGGWVIEEFGGAVLYRGMADFAIAGMILGLYMARRSTGVHEAK